MNPENDPAIAEGNDSIVEREGSPEQPPGTELAARREMLPAELVAPNRAGAIVAEFVNSIVEEAQARALDMIRAAAEQDDHGQREALESADRMRARIDVMAEELETAVGQLRQESARLAALHEQTTLASVTGTTLGSDTAEREALAQVAASLQRGEAEEPRAEELDDEPRAEEPDAEETHEVEVMAGHEEDEPEAEHEHEPLAEEAVEGHAEEELDDEPATAVAEDPRAEGAAAEPGLEEGLPADEESRAEAQPTVEDAEPVTQERFAMGEEPGPEERLGFEEGPRAEAQPAEEMELGPEERLRVDDAPPEDRPPEDEAFEEAEEAGPAEDPIAADVLSDEDELAQDQERFARMDDAELATAYSDALDQMDTQPAETPQGARLLRYAGSALGEALTRPTFADIGQGAPALEPVPRMGRRRRRRAEAINTLRRACAQAIEEMSAEEAAR